MNLDQDHRASPGGKALKVEALSVHLPDGRALIEALDFEIRPGEVLVLMGASGSGKSTVLAWLAGARHLQPTVHGRCWLGSRRLDRLAAEKRRLGLMLQQDYLFPHMSVGDNLLFALPGGRRSDRQARIAEALTAAGLSGMQDRDPASLSGGQRSRVSLLRTLLSEPEALLLDEPFSSLDRDLRAQIREQVWRETSALPVLLVTHDIEDVPAGATIIELSGASHA